MSLSTKPNNGYLGNIPKEPSYSTMVIGDRAHHIHNTVVYRFRMGDVEDPDLYAAQPIWDWQNTEVGKWVMSKAVEAPMWHKQPNYGSYGWDLAITAKLKDEDYTFWTLKWASTVDNQL